MQKVNEMLFFCVQGVPKCLSDVPEWDTYFLRLNTVQKWIITFVYSLFILINIQGIPLKIDSFKL